MDGPSEANQMDLEAIYAQKPNGHSVNLSMFSSLEHPSNRPKH
jgi:hypothetical protein